MTVKTECSETAHILFSTGSLSPLDTAQCFALAAKAGCDGIEVRSGGRSFSSRRSICLCPGAHPSARSDAG
jgi:hypothetical protein